MPVQRRRFRIEEASIGGMPMPAAMDGELGPMQREIMNELRAIRTQNCDSILAPAELESRLIEMGFVEGASVEILHEGVFGKDPIAVRVDNATVAIRRREAMAIMVA